MLEQGWPLLTALCARDGDSPLASVAPVGRWAFEGTEVPSPWSCPRLNQAFAPNPRPFRKLDEKGSLQWDRITCLEKGKIYRQVRAIQVGIALAGTLHPGL